MLLITLKNGRWNNDMFVFTGRGGRFDVVKDSTLKIHNYNKLFKELEKDSLFTITSIDDLQLRKLLKNKNKVPDALMVDGYGYEIELLSPGADRAFKFHCPKSLADHYQLIEYKRVVAIFEKLMRLMHCGDPC
jgi:hypothetical protein